MKLVVIVALGFLAVAHAGVMILSPQGEAHALDLYAKYCGGGQEGAELGGARVWCKRAPEELVEVLNHEIVAPASTSPDNIVFVQPPSVLYKHNIAVAGGTSIGSKTKIYVLPQQSTHSLTSQYNPGDVVTSKPTVYFLKSNVEGGGYGAPRYGAPLPSGTAGYA